MVDGLAAISCFCDYNRIPYEVVDVGIDSPDAVGLNYKNPARDAKFLRRTGYDGSGSKTGCRSRTGTGQLCGVSMGYNLLSFGEMGIGNTTTSAAVTDGSGT